MFLSSFGNIEEISLSQKVPNTNSKSSKEYTGDKFTWRDCIALLRGGVRRVDEVLLDQGGDVIRVEDGQVVEPEGQASDGFEVSLDSLVEKVHDLIGGSANRSKFEFENHFEQGMKSEAFEKLATRPLID